MKKYRSPLFMGVEGIITFLGLWVIGFLTIWGFFIHDTKNELLAIGESHTTPPYLQTAKILTKGNDFELAEKVLGLSTDTDELLHPEKEIQNKIVDLEKRVLKSPSRAIYNQLAVYYWQLKESDQARISLEKAEKIDPNNHNSRELRKLFGL